MSENTNVVEKGYELKTTECAITYHFVSKTSRFSDEFIDDRHKFEYNSNRNFIRKWGHFVKHNDTMKPIVPKRYDVGFVVINCDEYRLTLLEPWCDTIYTDVPYDRYVNAEQKNTKFNLKKKLKRYEDQKINDIVRKIGNKGKIYFVNIEKLQKEIANKCKESHRILQVCH